MMILDGFDYEFIKAHFSDLKFFSELYAKQMLSKLDSVIPADSIPSWTTIYTGRNPAEHGVIESIDYLNDKNNPTGNTAVIRGNSFWDVLSCQGKKVLVYNPFIAYPAWNVNGAMICGPVFEGGEVSISGNESIDKDRLPPLGGLVDHPTRKTMRQFFESNMDLTQRQFDSFDEIFSKGNFDFAFLGILTSDRMQHFLWKYCDETDRCHPKNNSLKNSILEMYQLMERNICSFFKKYSKEYNIIVISDHGHGRRCQKTFYINQWLISNGYIEERSRKSRITEYLKNGTLTILAKINAVQSGANFFKKFSFARKVKNADYAFSKRTVKTIYAPNFDGTNPFGGIDIKREAFASTDEYERTREDIINKLSQVKDQGKQVMLWVKKREEIYAGENVCNYPDIIYRMDNDYGVDRGLFGKRLFGISAFHEVISGGHRFEGIIMGNRTDVNSVGSVLNIHDYIISITGENND